MVDVVMQAAAYAAHAYRERVCKTDNMDPFINHALNITNFLIHRGGINNVTSLVASLLSHIETDHYCAEEVRQTFGQDVEALTFEVIVAKRLRMYNLLRHEAREVLLAEFAFNTMCLKSMRLTERAMQKFLEDTEEAVSQIGNINDALYTHYQDAVRTHKIKLD